ncbi:MAG: hypothetical protein QOH31_6023 [Verrucomicrobiota bacterium]|jgi:hypothetical protein
MYGRLSTFEAPAIHHLIRYSAQVWKLYDNMIGVSRSMIQRAQIFALFLADGPKIPKNRRSPGAVVGNFFKRTGSFMEANSEARPLEC